jgi:uncharacterized protein YbaP (TraB family)
MRRLWERFSSERELKMIWQVERDGRRSYLAGTAHFFPYRFRRSMRRVMRHVDTVLIEGPLDEASAQQVETHGRVRGDAPCLVDALGPEARARITQELAAPPAPSGSQALLHQLAGVPPDSLDWEALRAYRPWLAFFRIWFLFLRKMGWIYHMELDALAVARALGKEVRFLETIEEQLAALDGVPPERFVAFLAQPEWRALRRVYAEHFLRGDLNALIAGAGVFPTYCESIIANRDPVLYERMRDLLARGRTLVLVGATHCRGLSALLRQDGFEIRRPWAE